MGRKWHPHGGAQAVCTVGWQHCVGFALGCPWGKRGAGHLQEPRRMPHAGTCPGTPTLPWLGLLESRAVGTHCSLWRGAGGALPGQPTLPWPPTVSIPTLQQEAGQSGPSGGRGEDRSPPTFSATIASWPPSGRVGAWPWGWLYLQGHHRRRPGPRDFPNTGSWPSTACTPRFQVSTGRITNPSWSLAPSSLGWERAWFPQAPLYSSV